MPFPQSLAILVHQAGPVEAPVGDAAGPDQHPVPGPTAEVAPPPHRAVVLPLGAAQLQAQPEPRGEVRGAQVADGGHVVGAGEQDLHAHVEADLLGGRRGGGAQRGGGPWCAPGNSPTQ